MICTRREFAGLLAGTAASSTPLRALAPPGLDIGIHTFSFHEIREGGMAAVDQIIADTKQLDLNSVELFAPELAPFPMPEGFYRRWAVAAGTIPANSDPTPKPSPEQLQTRREALRTWRLSPPSDYFAEVKRKFAAARIQIFALNYSFDATMTDAELDAGFEQAKTLGTKVITTSSTISVAKRLAPFADKHGLLVAFHNTTSDDPDRLVSPQAYETILAMSAHYRINFDLAHYFAAGYDPIAFISSKHAQIVSMHIHDRKSHNGPSVPNGEGETPLRDVLHLLRDQHWNVPLFYELEWVGSGRAVPEIAKELTYLRNLV